MAQLQEERTQQAQRVHVRRARNAGQRAAYEALRAHAGVQEAALRRLEEEARELLERLVQRKARAAAERNLRNERRERCARRARSAPPGALERSCPLCGRGSAPAPGEGTRPAPRPAVSGLFFLQGQAGAGVPGAEEGCQADREHQRVRMGMRPDPPAEPPPRVCWSALLSRCCLQFYPPPLCPRHPCTWQHVCTTAVPRLSRTRADVVIGASTVACHTCTHTDPSSLGLHIFPMLDSGARTGWSVPWPS